MFRRFTPVAIFVLLSAFIAFAQSANPASRAPDTKTSDKLHRDDQDVTVPEDMRIKMAIVREETAYKKTLEDVDKLSDLSGEVAKDYAAHKQLSADDVKKLATIEKLAKRVLNHAGGEEVDAKSGTAEEVTIADAIDKLNTAAGNIRRDMKAETRFVVSATVIANSNEVINLSRVIRHIRKAD